MDTLEELLELKRVRMLAATGKAYRIRVAARITAVEMGRVAGVSGSTVTAWEKGEQFPRTGAALLWLRALDELAGATNDRP